MGWDRRDGEKTAAYVEGKIPCKPQVIVVLGSGWSFPREGWGDTASLSYGDVPGFSRTSVEGHAGRLTVGTWEGLPVATLEGRLHLYEGHPPAAIVHPIRVLRLLGATGLILTNAAGGIRRDLHPGTVMAISDHLNLTGCSPLEGEEGSSWGERFVDLSEVYDPGLTSLVLSRARRTGFADVQARAGVYACLRGPQYETPAEVRALRAMGADAVGMSSVLEAIAARQMGLRVAGISFIANRAAGLAETHLCHEDVLQAGRSAGEGLKQLLAEVLRSYGASPGKDGSG